MNSKRLFILIAASPFWLLIAIIVASVWIPVFIACTITAIIEYGFTGYFDPPWKEI